MRDYPDVGEKEPRETQWRRSLFRETREAASGNSFTLRHIFHVSPGCITFTSTPCGLNVFGSCSIGGQVL